MAADDLTAYVARVRRALRWHPYADVLVMELEDHLREAVERGRPAEEIMHDFGSPEEIARAYAVTTEGGLALPTRLTRAAGTVGVVAGLAWFASAIGGLFGQGDLITTWTVENYALWSALVSFSVVGAVVVFAGALFRAGGRRDRLTVTVVALGLLAVASSYTLTWAWAMSLLPLSVAAFLVGRRLRSLEGGPRGSWLLVAAWPLGAVTLAAMEALQVGYRDQYGDHPVAWVAGYTIASCLFALAVAGLGSRLRREEPVDLGRLTAV